MNAIIQILVIRIFYIAASTTTRIAYFPAENRSQTQGCYNIAKRCLKLTHVFIILALFAPSSPHPIVDAIILAAGRGARLRPLTDTLPKPLIEINGVSLIEIHLHRLALAGFSRIIINLHHLGELIRRKLGDGQRYGVQIIYSNEPGHALETAGGIVHALPLIKSSRFAAISADVLCDYDYQMLHHTKKAASMGTLVLIDNPAHHPYGDFALSDSGQLIASEAAEARQHYTYSGIACFKRALFESLPAGKRALRPVLEAAIEHKALSGEHYPGLWSDIGSKARLESARQSASVRQYIDSIKQSIS